MRFVCSECGFSGAAEDRPASCPNCGIPADGLWLLDEDAATLIDGARRRSTMLRRTTRTLGLAIVLCLIATPIGLERWPGEIGRKVADGTLTQPSDGRSIGGSGSGVAAAGGSATPSTVAVPEASSALSAPVSSDQGGGSGAPPPPRPAPGDGRPPGVPEGSFDTGAPIDAPYPPPTESGSRSAGAGAVGASDVEEREQQTCPGLSNPERGVVFIVDGSVSMGLPIDVPVATERSLDARIDNGDEQARAAYRALLAANRPKRLDFAKRVFGAAIGRLPSGVTAGVVTFRSCTTVESVGPVGRDGFGDLADHVRGLTIERGGETAITQSLHAGRTMLKPAGGRLILVTDGQETCRADPCSEHANAGDDGVVIDIVDLTGTASLECLAEATGGTVYNARGTLDVSTVIGFMQDRLSQACAR